MVLVYQELPRANRLRYDVAHSEASHSGRVRSLGKRVGCQSPRRFESSRLRQVVLARDLLKQETSMGHNKKISVKKSASEARRFFDSVLIQIMYIRIAF